MAFLFTIYKRVLTTLDKMLHDVYKNVLLIDSKELCSNINDIIKNNIKTKKIKLIN